MLSGLSTWLERSGNRDLDIVIRGPSKEMKNNHAGIRKLVEHASRWGKLKLTNNTVDCDDFRLIKGQLGQLRELDINCYSEVDQVDLFEMAPNLRTLKFYGLGLSSFIFPPSSLTHIELKGTNDIDALNIISQVHSLIDLILTDIRSTRIPPSQAHVTSPMKALTLNSCTAIVNVMDFLIVSSLADLSISAYSTHSPPAFVGLLKRSKFRLKRLSLHGCHVTSSELVKMMYEIETLEELYINQLSRAAISDLMEQLTYRPDGPDAKQLLLQRLQFIKITYLNSSTTSFYGLDAILEMAASRRGVVYSVKAFPFEILVSVTPIVEESGGDVMEGGSGADRQKT